MEMVQINVPSLGYHPTLNQASIIATIPLLSNSANDQGSSLVGLQHHGMIDRS